MTRFASGREQFRNREAAGLRLADVLRDVEKEHPLILGIPRGGVPVAAEVARALTADLDVIVARKLGAPHNPELAIGAVTSNGGLFIDHELIRDLDVRDAYLDDVIARESAIAHNREVRFRGGRPAPRVEGRSVIVVDDGLATGATMRAAVRSLRKHDPARLIVAVPVGSAEAISSLKEEADEVICPVVPEPFIAVGLYYEAFLPVEDAAVERILATFHERVDSSASPAST